MCAQFLQSWIIQLMLLLNSKIRLLCDFSPDNFDQYTSNIHESIKRFCNRAVINVFFNNKRKLSIDSTVPDGVKAFKKRQREK